MEFIIAILVASFISVPYRKLKIRYMLMSQTTNVSGNEFYGSEEMLEEFNTRLAKIKTDKSEEK